MALIIPTIFAIANNSLKQQLYIIRPMIVNELNSLYAPIDNCRFWLKFFLSLAWLGVLWFNFTLVFRESEEQ